MTNGKDIEPILGPEGEPINKVIIDLMNITRGNRVDPVLLDSVCRFAFYLFYHESIKYSRERSEQCIQAVLNIDSLLGYLGGKNYLWLVDRSRMI